MLFCKVFKLHVAMTICDYIIFGISVGTLPKITNLLYVTVVNFTENITINWQKCTKTLNKIVLFFYCNSMRIFEYIMFIMSGASSKLELMCKTRIIWSIYLYDVSFSIVLAGSLGNKSKRF